MTTHAHETKVTSLGGDVMALWSWVDDTGQSARADGTAAVINDGTELCRREDAKRLY